MSQNPTRMPVEQNELKKSVKEQLKKLKRICVKVFDEYPFHYEMDEVFHRTNEMKCEDFDKYLNKKLEEWKEALNDDRSCWSGIMTFEVDCQIDHETGDKDGMPMEWIVSVRWESDLGNPFDMEEPI